MLGVTAVNRVKHQFRLFAPFLSDSVTSKHFCSTSGCSRKKKLGEGGGKETGARVREKRPQGGSQPGLQGGVTKDPLSVFKPILVKPNPDDLNFGEEIAGKINKQALLKELNKFYTNPEIKILCKDHGLDDYLYNQVLHVCVSPPTGALHPLQ